MAQKLNLKGFVKNLPDGRVEVDAEGEVESVEALQRWCKQGPSGARVDEILWEETNPIGHDNFHIRL